MVAWRVPIVGLAVGLSAFCSSMHAGAQEQPGYASNHFNPSERGSRWFVLDSLDMRGQGRLALGVVNDYSYRSLVDYHADGTVAASMVRNQVKSHLGASFVLADRFRLGLSVPVQLYADGRTATINGITHRPAQDVAAGDVRFAGDVRLFGEHGDAATMAAGVQLFLPSGSPAAYTGDGKPRVLPHVLFAGQSSILAYSAKVGFLGRVRDEAFGDGQIGDALVYGASVGAVVADQKLLVGPEVFGSTVVSAGRAFENRTTPIELLLGAHYDLGSDLRVGAGVGTQLTRGYGAPVARGLLSFEWVPGNAKPEVVREASSADRDGDGVPDAQDACGFVKGPKSDDPTKNGCPIVDRDGDGIPDSDDACPTVPGPASSDPQKHGCAADTDGDGVADDQDACPNEKGKRSLEPLKNGCPDRDRDGDGVLDADDACPDVKGVRSTDAKTNGCPDPDRDHDSVPNDVDACPDEPGAPDPDPKKNGCPKAILQNGTIKILDQVRFKNASAEIAPGKDSEDVLQAVLAVLKAHPEITLLRVEGHTDDRGAPAANKTLSTARAAAVAKWLVDHGIAKDRLTSVGFGEEKPLEPNTSDEARGKNRRVEFHVESGSGR